MLEFCHEDWNIPPTRRPQRDESCSRVHSTLLSEVSVRIQDNCAKIITIKNYEDFGIVYFWILTLTSSGRCIEMHHCDSGIAEDDEWRSEDHE